MKRIVLLLVVVGVGASTGTLRADTVPHNQYSSQDGLPSEKITALAQTNNGLLWVGTQRGLAVYEGEEFRGISLPDSIRRSEVAALHPMPDGSVWVGVGHDAVRVSPQGSTRTLLLGEHPVSEILRRGDTMLFVTAQALWTLEPNQSAPTRTSFKFGASTTSPVVWGADVGPKDQLWLAEGRRGPARIRPDGRALYPTDSASSREGLQSASPYGLQFVEDETALVVLGEELYRFDAVSETLDRVTSLPSSGYIDYRGGPMAYLTHQSRILRYDTRAHQMREPIALPGDSDVRTSVILRGREGALWVGTETAGLFRIANPEERHRRSIAGTKIRNGLGFREKGQALWGNTWGAGLFQIRPHPRQTTPEGYTLWVLLPSHDEGLHALASPPEKPGREWFRWTPEGDWRAVGHASEAVRGYVDANGVGYFWHNDGLYRHVPAGDTTEATELRSWPVGDSQHHLMGPAPNGDIILFDEGTLFRLRRPEGAVVDTIAAIPEHAQSGGRRLRIDAAGRIWCPFRGNGVLRVDPTQGTQKTVLPGRVVEKITLAGDSLAMANTDEGLYLLDARTGTVKRHLTTADGLMSEDVNGSALVGDTLYIGHQRGVTLLPTESLLTPPPRPHTVITGLEVNLEDRPVSADSLFGKDDRAVGISYTAASLSHADRVRYEVRLSSSNGASGDMGIPNEDAHDGGWSEATREFVRYTNLDPGTYRFEVRARLGGRPPGPAVQYEFTIPPHVYETWWFRLLVGVGVLGVGVGAWQWRTHRLRRRQQELEAAVQARTEELRARTEQLAEEKQKTEAQAERLAELDEAKNRFLAHISHEFRTPLSLILSPLRDALQRASAGAATLGENQLRRMCRNAGRLQRLIEQLLDLATLEAGQMTLDRQPGNLATLVKRSAEAFRSKAERKGIDLRVETPEGQVPARFDPEKVETIVSNLVGNAVKYTPEGGRITVRIDTTDEEGVGVDGPEETVARIEVADTGPGIEPAAQEHVFDRFRRVRSATPQNHEGMGLGLALTSELVELHGGTIEVESAPGKGSTFTAWLPLRPVAGGDGCRIEARSTEAPMAASCRRRPGEIEESVVVPPAADEEQEEGACSGEATVLVVEDNAEMRAYLREQLGRRWNVLDAAEGEDGWETVREARPDLVVSDVMMPGTDGVELCRRIKEQEELRTIPVILLTARASDEDEIEGLQAGADSYVAKPFDVAGLRQRIENHLSARRHAREQHQNEVRFADVETTVEADTAPFLKEVLDAVETHLSNPDFTTDQLAEEVALSRRQLTRRLKDVVGETPAAFVRQRRIERAKELLRGQAETVAEVAYAVGFRSPSHFSQVFQEKTGDEPTSYQHNNGASADEDDSENEAS